MSAGIPGRKALPFIPHRPELATVQWFQVARRAADSASARPSREVFYTALDRGGCRGPRASSTWPSTATVTPRGRDLRPARRDPRRFLGRAAGDRPALD